MERREEMNRDDTNGCVALLSDEHGGAGPLSHPRKSAWYLTGFGRVPKLVEHARQRRGVAGDSGSNVDGGHRLQVSTPRGTFSSVAATPLSQTLGRQLVPHLDFI